MNLIALIFGAAIGLGICFLVTGAIWLVFSGRHVAVRAIALITSILLMGSVTGEPWRVTLHPNSS